MADEPGIVESTITEAKAHPWLIGGAIVAAVLALYLISRGSSSKGTSFTYSSGPSEAQINANTALAVTQQKDQTALGLAKINADSTASTAQNYFSYLTTASANALASNQIASNTTLGVANIAGYTTQRANDDKLAATANTNQAAVTLAGIASSRDQNLAAISANTAGYIAGVNAGVADYAVTNQSYQAALSAQTAQGNVAIGLIPPGWLQRKG